MDRRIIETILSAFVLLVASFFLYITFGSTIPKEFNGYEVRAKFLKIGGIEIGSDVRISGVNVGSIINQFLDDKTYEANLILYIDKNIKLPIDTQAKIVGDGLLGAKYVDLIPGSNANFIKTGDFISNTRDYISLEDMVGDIIFQITED